MLDSFRMNLTLTGPRISPWGVISTSIIRNLSDELRHNIVMHKPKKLETTKMSNTNKMRVELLTAGETEDEKWVEHLKRRINLGTWSLRRLWDIHCRWAEMEAWCGRDTRPERKIWDLASEMSTGHRNHVLWQQWRPWGKGLTNKADSKVYAPFSRRKNVYMCAQKEKSERKMLKAKCWNYRWFIYYFSLYSSVFSFKKKKKSSVFIQLCMISEYNAPAFSWMINICIFHYLKKKFNPRCSNYCLVLQIRKWWQHQ